MLHAAVYCGLPTSVDAFRIAENALKEHKLLEHAPAGCCGA